MNKQFWMGIPMTQVDYASRLIRIPDPTGHAITS